MSRAIRQERREDRRDNRDQRQEDRQKRRRLNERLKEQGYSWIERRRIIANRRKMQRLDRKRDRVEDRADRKVHRIDERQDRVDSRREQPWEKNRQNRQNQGGGRRQTQGSGSSASAYAQPGRQVAPGLRLVHPQAPSVSPAVWRPQGQGGGFQAYRPPSQAVPEANLVPIMDNRAIDYVQPEYRQPVDPRYRPLLRPGPYMPQSAAVRLLQQREQMDNLRDISARLNAYYQMDDGSYQNAPVEDQWFDPTETEDGIDFNPFDDGIEYLVQEGIGPTWEGVDDLASEIAGEVAAIGSVASFSGPEDLIGACEECGRKKLRELAAIAAADRWSRQEYFEVGSAIVSAVQSVADRIRDRRREGKGLLAAVDRWRDQRDERVAQRLEDRADKARDEAERHAELGPDRAILSDGEWGPPAISSAGVLIRARFGHRAAVADLGPGWALVKTLRDGEATDTATSALSRVAAAAQAAIGVNAVVSAFPGGGV